MADSLSDFESTRLSSSVTIAKYRTLEADQDRKAIADFVRERFTERYVEPVHSMGKKHGFCVMAVSCLLIEAITSFKMGWQAPTDRRDKPYRGFFREFSSFGVSPAQADLLYDQVRSGILHQGETTGGWRIHRRGPLVDFARKTINANLFAKEVVNCLDQYCDQLERATWQKPIWQNLRNRMGAVIRNCQRV